MNDRLGFVFYGDDDSRPNPFGGFGEGREYSEETAKAIDEEVKKLIDHLYEETRKILEANRDRVEAVAKALVKYETLDASNIEQDDLEEARDKVRWGRARKSRVIDEKEKMATAYHEAGHAVVQWLEKDADPVHKVTIIPRGNFGGATFALPEKDRSNYSRRWCIATMKTMFAGRIAEEMFTNDINTGALGDIRQASGLARRMVREWGMNDRLGFVYYGEDDSRPNMLGGFGDGREYSEETAKAIDEEVKKLIDNLYDQTRRLLEANRDKVDAIAKALVHHETLDSSDIDRIMRGESLNKPSVRDLLEKESTRRGGAVIAPAEQPSEPDVQLGGGAMPAPG
jgi:cell division protease FtsH